MDLQVNILLVGTPNVPAGCSARGEHVGRGPSGALRAAAGGLRGRRRLRGERPSAAADAPAVRHPDRYREKHDPGADYAPARLLPSSQRVCRSAKEVGNPSHVCVSVPVKLV